MLSDKKLVARHFFRILEVLGKGADLWGSPGTSGLVGELPGKFGKLPGNLWIAVKFHSERTSGEVVEEIPGKFGELPGKSLGSSGEPDSPSQ